MVRLFELKLTMPELCVKVPPLCVKFPPILNADELEVNVPAVWVKVPDMVMLELPPVKVAPDERLKFDVPLKLTFTVNVAFWVMVLVYPFVIWKPAKLGVLKSIAQLVLDHVVPSNTTISPAAGRPENKPVPSSQFPVPKPSPGVLHRPSPLPLSQYNVVEFDLEKTKSRKTVKTDKRLGRIFFTFDMF